MSYIYKVINPENGEEQLLVSKEYVDLRIKALKEAFNTHIQNVDSAHTDSSDKTIKNAALLDSAELVDLLFKEENKDIPAENIKTDPLHKFVTQSQLEVFKSKPSSFEVETLISNAYNNMKNRFNEMYAKLLNMPDAVKKLKEVSNLLNNDVNANTLIKALKSKVNEEDFKEHTESVVHLNNNDRKALNILIDLIKDGTINKIQQISLDYVETAYNSMNLDGKTSEQIRSRGEYNKIFAIAGYCENQADYYFPAECRHLNGEIGKIELYNIEGKVLFRESVYVIPEFLLDRSNVKNKLIIVGCGNATVFDVTRLFCNNLDFNSCSIKNADYIQVKENVVFKDVEFTNCNITMDNANMCKFIDCTFNHCTISFNGSCRYNRFADCLFNRTKQPKYIGGNNVFSGNIETI